MRHLLLSTLRRDGGREATGSGHQGADIPFEEEGAKQREYQRATAAVLVQRRIRARAEERRLREERDCSACCCVRRNKNVRASSS